MSKRLFYICSYAGVIISEASQQNVSSHIRHHENIPFFRHFKIDYYKRPFSMLVRNVRRKYENELRAKLKLHKKTVKLNRSPEMLRKYAEHWLYFK